MTRMSEGILNVEQTIDAVNEAVIDSMVHGIGGVKISWDGSVTKTDWEELDELSRVQEKDGGSG